MPSTLEFFGILLAASDFSSFLPKEKQDRISVIIDNFLDSQSISKKDVLFFLGHNAHHSSRLTIYRTPSLSPLFYSVRITPVDLNHSSLAGRKLWKLFLEECNGLSMFYNDFLTTFCLSSHIKINILMPK